MGGAQRPEARGARGGRTEQRACGRRGPEDDITCSAPSADPEAGKAAGGYDMRLPALLQINYTLGDQAVTLLDSLSISELNTSYTVSHLWQQAGLCFVILDPT